jgi:hypothetical protein
MKQGVSYEIGTRLFKPRKIGIAARIVSLLWEHVYLAVA